MAKLTPEHVQAAKDRLLNFKDSMADGHTMDRELARVILALNEDLISVMDHLTADDKPRRAAGSRNSTSRRKPRTDIREDSA